MFLPFLLNLIEKKSTQNNKYNVVRNKNSKKQAEAELGQT